MGHVIEDSYRWSDLPPITIWREVNGQLMKDEGPTTAPAETGPAPQLPSKGRLRRMLEEARQYMTRFTAVFSNVTANSGCDSDEYG